MHGKRERLEEEGGKNVESIWEDRAHTGVEEGPSSSRRVLSSATELPLPLVEA